MSKAIYDIFFEKIDFLNIGFAIFYALKYKKVSFFGTDKAVDRLFRFSWFQSFFRKHFIHIREHYGRFDPKTHEDAYNLAEYCYNKFFKFSNIEKILNNIESAKEVNTVVRGALGNHVHGIIMNLYQVKFIQKQNSVSNVKPVFCFNENLFYKVLNGYGLTGYEYIPFKSYLYFLRFRNYLDIFIYIAGLIVYISTACKRRGLCLRPKTKGYFRFAGDIHMITKDFSPRPYLLVDGVKIKSSDFFIVDDIHGQEKDIRAFASEKGLGYINYHKSMIPTSILLARTVYPIIIKGFKNIIKGTWQGEGAYLFKVVYAISYFMLLDESFFSQYRISWYISWKVYGYTHIIKTISIHKYGGKTAYYIHGNLPHIFINYCYLFTDILGITSMSQKTIFSQYWCNNTNLIIMGDIALELMKNEYNSMEAKRKLENKLENIFKIKLPKDYFIISAFDSYYYPEGGRFKDYFTDYYGVLEDICNKYENVFIILKLASNHEILNDYFGKGDHNKRLHIGYDYEFSTPELIPQSDLVTCGWWSTIGIQGLSARTPVLFYLGGKNKNIYPYESCHPYDKYNTSILVSRIPDEFKHKIINFIENKEYISKELWEDIVRDRGVFIDDNGLDRFRNAILTKEHTV
ncbi:hypothetical protein MBAV_005718 [Candidatus Magnetobacterium bavaricum]|uniref:Uncharacterized protein n=1 Tax=Candidatus Magnetobacterium bavaricum TaxID=29290 RepID=A0A0F3GMZ4_9BACT|nr:hypothetical protein MBAV_005718 [Candidatus Magnetobacterium bavaricum]